MNLRPHQVSRLALAGAVTRAMTHDNFMTFGNRAPVMDHSPLWGQWNNPEIPVDPGHPLGYGPTGSSGGVKYMTADGELKTVDSTGAFLVGELERLDLTMHKPLASVKWGRDIDVREDATIADEVTSFTLSTFASAGTLGTGQGIGTGKAWAGKNTDQIGGVGIDISKVTHALTIWALELKYSIPELESAAKIGRPVDAQKYAGLQLKYQMDVDEQVYFGDTSLGVTGLINDAGVTPVGFAAGVAGGVQWNTKTPDEILNDVNLALTTVWENSAWEFPPSNVLLPTKVYGYISTQKVSLAGNESILNYIKRNNLYTQETGQQLGLYASKWCNGAGAGGTIGTGAAGKDRMVVYTKDYERVRFPLTLLQRTPVQYDGLYHKATYFGRIGALELVYPDTVGYFDGLG